MVCSSFPQMFTQASECAVFSQVSNTSLDVFLCSPAQCIQRLRLRIIQAVMLYEHFLIRLGQLLHCLIQICEVWALRNHNRLFRISQGVVEHRRIQAGCIDWFSVMVWPDNKICTGKAVVDDSELCNAAQVTTGVIFAKCLVKVLNNREITF